MKRLLIILLLFPAILQAQTTYPIRGISRVVYGGDTLDTKFSTDSTKLVTNNKAFVFNKTVKVNKDTLATNAYARSVGGGGGTITSDSLNFDSDILQWDRVNKAYKPYTYDESLVLGKIYKDGSNNLYARGMSFQRYGEVHINNVQGSTFLSYGGEADLNSAKFGNTSDSITIHKSGYIRQYVGGVLKAEIRNGYIHQSWGADVTAASTITPTGPMFAITNAGPGVVSITNINLPYSGFSGEIKVIFTGAQVCTLGTGGNISVGTTVSLNADRVYTFMYRTSDSKWYVSN